MSKQTYAVNITIEGNEDPDRVVKVFIEKLRALVGPKPTPRHVIRYSLGAHAWLVYDPDFDVKAACLTEASAIAAKRLLDS